MATLEKIRNKGGIFVAAFIFLALLAFVLSDFMSSGSTLFRGSKMYVGKVNDKEIAYNDFIKRVNEMEEFSRLQSGQTPSAEQSYGIRDQVYQSMVRELVLGDQYEALGISVTDEEMVDMTVGNNINQNLRQLFANPQTGQFDKAVVINFFKNKEKDANASFYWSVIEKQLKEERLFDKYKSLLRKGTYVTKNQVDYEMQAASRKVTFDVVAKRYMTVSDSSITVSKSEMEDYYDAHKEKYKQDATVDIEYVTFDVVPSADDKKATEEWINKAKVDFSKPEVDAAQYVTQNSDNAYDDSNLKLDQVASQVRSFVAAGSVNDVYGPYFENDTYKLTRIVAINQVPDSVKARHILIKADVPNADAKADSIMGLIKRGADFASTARTNSQDQGSAVNGGDLGWFKEGMMVKPFNDACFKGAKGEIVKVQSQFGVHIIQIQEKGAPTTKYQLATLDKKLASSNRTHTDTYNKANRFAAEHKSAEKFAEGAKQQNLAKKSATGVKANDRQVGAVQSRELVKWAFEAEKGDLSPVFELENQFVLAVLKNKTEKGYASIASQENSIKADVRREKKAEQLIKEMAEKSKGETNLTSVAQKMSENVVTAHDVNFASYQVPSIGVEPAIVGVASVAKPGVISAPIKGNSGVYLIKVNIESANATGDANTQKMQLTQMNSYKADYKAYESLEKKYEIEDNRISFF